MNWLPLHHKDSSHPWNFWCLQQPPLPCFSLLIPRVPGKCQWWNNFPFIKKQNWIHIHICLVYIFKKCLSLGFLANFPLVLWKQQIFKSFENKLQPSQQLCLVSFLDYAHYFFLPQIETRMTKFSSSLFSLTVIPWTNRSCESFVRKRRKSDRRDELSEFLIEIFNTISPQLEEQFVRDSSAGACWESVPSYKDTETSAAGWGHHELCLGRAVALMPAGMSAGRSLDMRHSRHLWCQQE